MFTVLNSGRQSFIYWVFKDNKEGKEHFVGYAK